MEGCNKPNLLDLLITNDENSISKLEYSSPLGKSDNYMISFDFECFVKVNARVILQSHYPNRRSANGWRATFWKIGRRRPIVGRRRHRFWLNFWSADDFFVEAPKLKVSLTDPPIFMGFVIVEASGDGRPMIGRQSADVLKKCTS